MKASRTGVANLPLHGGKAPRWLFERMTRLARQICICIVEEQGPDEMLLKMADPYWFQAFGCVLGFDWHSSGLTTTACGALKEGIRDIENDLGFFVAGGKGATSRKTPGQILERADQLSSNPDALVYASKMAAKVDSSALQDGYQLYHHVFLFTRAGSWAVVQQGMNDATRYARRYHWLGDNVTDFVCEPHAAICSERKGSTLNLIATESDSARREISRIGREDTPEKTIADLKRLQSLDLPARHHIIAQDIRPDRLRTILLKTYEQGPEEFEHLLGLPGVGPKTIRALALLAELIYQSPASISDPARFSFAHGGKDGHPYPVDRRTYDQSIHLLKNAVLRARIDANEKRLAVNRLDDWHFKQVE